MIVSGKWCDSKGGKGFLLFFKLSQVHTNTKQTALFFQSEYLFAVAVAVSRAPISLQLSMLCIMSNVSSVKD